MKDMEPMPEYVHKANAKKLLAEAAKEKNLAEKERLQAEGYAIDLRKKQEEEARRMADDDHAHVYRFVGEVNQGSVANAIKQLSTWSRTDPGCDITIYWSSPGGNVVEGLALFDFLTELREQGHSITGITRGYAASMAGILLQACDHRVIGKESWVLIHEVSAGMMGSFGELEDRLKWLQKVQNRILDIFAARSAGKKSRDDFEHAWQRTDFWLSSDDAVTWGVVDEVA